jgi:hypothetical protein
MNTRTLPLFVLSLLVGLVFAASASAKRFCFGSDEFRWNVDRRSGTGTARWGVCPDGTPDIWSVSGTIEKTARKEYDVNLTATPSQCSNLCYEWINYTGHFSGKSGSGVELIHFSDACYGETYTDTWTGTKERCP